MKDDGGPAFPQTPFMVLAGTPGERMEWPGEYGLGGMSLRDWFAGQAMARVEIGLGYNLNPYAERAYEIADAMLAARAEPTPADPLAEAAPDLLAALHWWVNPPHPIGSNAERCAKFDEIAENAIAKAKGD